MRTYFTNNILSNYLKNLFEASFVRLLRIKGSLSTNLERGLYNTDLASSYNLSLLIIGTNFKQKKNSFGQWTMNFSF